GVVHPSVGAQDRISYHAAGDHAAGAHGHMGAHHAVGERHVLTDEARLDHHAVLALHTAGHQRGVAVQEAEHLGVGVHHGVLVAAVHPHIHAAGLEAGALPLHVLHGVGELVLALVLDVVVDEVLHLAPQALAVG